MTKTRTKELTGRHVAIMFGLFFGVTLAANITMLVQAVSTFSGLVVPNSYVASQNFDQARTAQEALNWRLKLSYTGNEMHLSIKNEQGNLVRPNSIRLLVGRPTSEDEDQDIDVVPAPDGYSGPVKLGAGRWRVEVSAQDLNGTKFRQRLNLEVPGIE